MMNVQQSAFDRACLEYDHFLSSCSTSSNALNRIISPSYPSGQKFMQKKGSPSKSPIWKEKILSDFSSFLISCMICGVVWVSLILMLCLFVWFFFFFFFFFCALFFLIKKLEKSEKYKNNVCLCILVLMYLGWPLKQGFLTLYHL